MRLSTRSTYGMRALVELALASGRGPVSASLISKRQALSVAYLEQLLHRLKKHGLVRSIRGPRGGYLLAKHPQQITMADIVRVLDGEPGAWDNGREGNGHRRSVRNGTTSSAVHSAHGLGRAGRPRAEEKEAYRHAQRIAQAVWQCVHERLTQSLDAVTLQDLCDEIRTQAGEPLDHRYVFHI